MSTETMWLRMGWPNTWVHMAGWDLEHSESFLPGRGKELDLLTYLKQLKIWDNGFQDTGSQATKDSDLQTQRTNEMSPVTASLCWPGQFPGHSAGRQNTGKSWKTPWVEETELNLRRPRQLEFTGQRAGEVRATWLQVLTESPPQVLGRVLRSPVPVRMLSEPEAEQAPEKIRGIMEQKFTQGQTEKPVRLVVIQSDWKTS